MEFTKSHISRLKNYRIGKNGIIKTPTGRIRRPVVVVVGGVTIKVQKFPEIPGFGNINIKYL